MYIIGILEEFSVQMLSSVGCSDYGGSSAVQPAPPDGIVRPKNSSRKHHLEEFFNQREL